MIYLKLLGESFLFAINSLRSNLLRTILSLVGVTIGILLIISVLTVVDSLERSINDSLSALNKNNMDIRQFPYEFGPDFAWWDYFRRPYSTWEEYEYLRDNLENVEGITILAATGGGIVKSGNSSSNNVVVIGASHSLKDVYEINVEAGRYFTPEEDEAGRNVALIGHRVAQDIFQDRNPIGKVIIVKGQKLTVIGTLKEEGEGLLGGNSNDDQLYVPYRTIKKMYYSGRNTGIESRISMKGKESDTNLEALEWETRGLLRRIRGLKPKEKDNFSLNRQEALIKLFGGFFTAMKVAGWFIGGFSILVGGFGTANIMFVSVRERTHIIGIQKSLGAKNYFILFQFLFESIFLCLLGGGIGLFIVFLLSFINLGSLDLVLSFGNVLVGTTISTVIGVVAGIVPAIQASRMDPVIAIRTQ
jgi:putative ABC transport system permease protein